MSMVCGHNSSASSIKWNFKNPAMLGESPLFDGSNTFGGFVVHIFMNLFSREVILTKKKTQMEDAGIYKCIVDLPDQMVIRTAQLIVLASDPQCDTNTSDEDNGVLEGTFLRMWCNISISGDFAPVMHWWRNDATKFESTTTIRSGQMSYTITTELRAEDNNKIYSCSSYFLPLNSTDALQPGITRARNAPTYTYQWNFTAVVWFGPINISVTSVKNTNSLNDDLQCLANGNPPPTYTWTTGVHDIATGANLTIDQNTARNIPGVIHCIATNPILSASINITVGLSISRLSETSSALLAIMIVGSTCAILLIIVFSMIAVRIKEAVGPRFQREPINEPDIVQHADNDGDYARPEELLMVLENQCQRPEDGRFEQDLRASDQVAGPAETSFHRYVEPVFPVYGAVRKTSKGVEPDLGESCVSMNPVYAEVNKCRGELISDNEAISRSSESEEMKQPSVWNTGKAAQPYEADYLDMRGFRACSTSAKDQSKSGSPMFSTSEYASIDHTLMPPPPPKLD